MRNDFRRMDAFQPRSVMKDPDRFSGRRVEFLRLAEALTIKDSLLVIIGERGVGKSSLAAQVRQLAGGDSRLLERYQAKAPSRNGDESFITLYLRCTSTVTSVDALMNRMQNLLLRPKVVASPHTGDVRIVSRVVEDGVLTGDLRGDVARVTLSELEELRQDKRLSLEEQVLAGTLTYTSTLARPILIVIDEADQIGSRTGLASFLRSASSPTVKFLLVGIAGTLSDLLTDHESVERMASVVDVPRMSADEAGEVIERALNHLATYGRRYFFDDSARRLTIEKADGYPWLVHLIGSAALSVTSSEGRNQITHADVSRSLLRITQQDLAPLYDIRLSRAIRGSRERARVLRELAQHGTDSLAERELLERTNLKLSETIHDDLASLSSDSDALIERSRLKGENHYSIREPMIAMYLRLRPLKEV